MTEEQPQKGKARRVIASAGRIGDALTKTALKGTWGLTKRLPSIYMGTAKVLAGVYDSYSGVKGAIENRGKPVDIQEHFRKKGLEKLMENPEAFARLVAQEEARREREEAEEREDKLWERKMKEMQLKGQVVNLFADMATHMSRKGYQPSEEGKRGPAEYFKMFMEEFPNIFGGQWNYQTQ